MDTKNKTSSQNKRYLKLSLKKNRLQTDVELKKHNRNSDVIILDESLDRMQLDTHKPFDKPKTFSPIVIDDSSILSDDDLPGISLPDKEPSKGSESFNCSKNSLSPVKESRPSIGGWSPCQAIITANPKNDQIPSTPNDKANESFECCTMKTIEKSHKKILNDLYGNVWKSIPGLFKKSSQNHDNFNGVSKKLFDDDDVDYIDERKLNRNLIKQNKELYLKNNGTDETVGYENKTLSDVKKSEVVIGGTERKSKKKLFTEKVPSTPDLPTRKIKAHANTTTKKVKIKKGMSITELVEIISKNNINSANVDTEDIQSSEIDNDVKENILTNKNNNMPNKINNLTNKNNTLTNKGSSSPEKENDLTNKEKKLIKNSKKLTNKENDLPSKGNYLTEKDDLLEKNVDKKNKNVDILTKKIDNVCITPDNSLKRLSFVGSMADNIPTWQCHWEAFQYRDNYKSMKEQLARRLFTEFNKEIFGDSMPADLAILWETKFRSTAGTTTNRLVKHASGNRIRTSIIKLSTKVLDTPVRLRDTLVHEMCHAATWLIDGELRAGHGPLWNKWAKRALQVFPELGAITRCHDLQIHFKYTFKCTKCGYSFHRHSKSVDITKKCCGHCRGKFEIVVNKKNKDGVVVATPARQATANGFAQYVKENYATTKHGDRTHAQVMKILGEQYSARKNKQEIEDAL